MSILAAIIIAFTPNDAGGRIGILDEHGGCPEGQALAISFGSNGDTVQGCWMYETPLVFVRWQDGTLKTYPVENFTLTPKAQEGVK